MTTAIEARNASALALCKLNGTRVPHHMDEVESELVMRTAWPILSAPLREMHKPTRVGSRMRCFECATTHYPCPTVQELDRIDRELGIDHQPGTERAVPCPAHRPVQHRDARPPWCNACGLTEGGEVPTGPLDHRNRS